MLEEKGEYVILVDECDKELGSAEKLKVHREGKLHRAFSIFIFNSEGKMLIQKRASTKYHSGGLWSNACCSHQRVSESLLSAVHRRLKEELGFDCKLTKLFDFIYKAEVDNGLIEYEFDHVFVGVYDGEIRPNSTEVADWKWVEPEKLMADITRNPNNYTIWFKKALPQVIKAYVKLL